jgi:hypothetical protein
VSTSPSNSTTRFDIDVAFELVNPNDESGSSHTAGKISAAGSDIVVDCVSVAALLSTGFADINAVRAIAQVLADRGVTLELRGPEGKIARIGEVKASLAQRVVTGSRNIELGRISQLLSLWAQRPKGKDRVGAQSLLPPSTLFPLVPTVSRNVRRKVTTTHYTHGSGRPRLIFVIGSEKYQGQAPKVFDLTKDVTTIGSSPDADLYMQGAEPLHAEIRHTREDEYVLHSYSNVGTGIEAAKTSAAFASGGVILRTGSQIRIGEGRMAFYREEYADHGRPHGGRAGGEYSFQKPQAPRKVRPVEKPAAR